MSSDRLIKVAVLLSSVCALALTTLVVAKEFDLIPVARAASTVEVPDWRSLADGGHAVGPASAPATMIVFGDYQCPFCAKFETSIDSLTRLFPAGLRVVMRHLPLETIHPHARRAAIAAECASAHGRFTQMHQGLYGSQATLDSAVIERVALQAGVADLGALRTCMADVASARRVNEDVAAAERLGLTGTPAIILNGTRFLHPPTIEELATKVRRLQK